jgi:hypothetical protein
MTSFISEIKEDLRRSFSIRSLTTFDIEYIVDRSSLGKNLDKTRLELEHNIKQYIVEDLEHNNKFEIKITIQKGEDNDFTVNFLFIKK